MANILIPAGEDLPQETALVLADLVSLRNLRRRIGRHIVQLTTPFQALPEPKRSLALATVRDWALYRVYADSILRYLTAMPPHSVPYTRLAEHWRKVEKMKHNRQDLMIQLIQQLDLDDSDQLLDQLKEDR